MQINFTKMQGIGNDFVVIDAINQKIALTRDQIRHIANRHFGVGCDQLLLVESSERQDAEFRYRIFNADGGEVEQCGNGARCFARFVTEEGLTDSQVIPVETKSGLIQLELEDDGRVTVDMGEPDFNPASLPFDAKGTPEYHELVVNDEKYAIGAVSMGNPHAVLLVDSLKDAPVQTLGAAIESHPRFPQRVNVGFMEIEDRDNIRLRVYERGAGETMACGTGACAAVAVGIKNRLLDARVQVELRGGDLTIYWPGTGSHLMMTGPAENVYKGQIEL
ncbi:MAG: diaminopimelate epimerase [Gammaproteobacteria bacterium]|nr:diaminopimelate epimerase [Gammaproteobacteria bacterium]